jgi:hypothetical protein
VVSFQGAVGAQSVSGAFLPSAGVLRGDDDAREHVSGDGRDVVAFSTRSTMRRVAFATWSGLARSPTIRCCSRPATLKVTAPIPVGLSNLACFQVESVHETIFNAIAIENHDFSKKN